MNNNDYSSKSWKRYGKCIMKNGIGFGSALAIAISFSVNNSVWLAILHGLLGWLYVVYYALSQIL